MKAFLLAWLAAYAVSAQAPSTAQFIASHLSANSLRADVSFLASDALEGRGTPSRGLDIAAEYIAAQFRRAGLEPAGDSGYFQTASFENVTAKTEGLDFSVEAGGKVYRASPAAIQNPALLDLKSAQVVKAPADDAASLDALAGDQVRGKVLAVIAPEAAQSATGRGGFAVIRRIPALVAKLQPALVVIVGGTGGGRAGGAHLRETGGEPAVPILTISDPQIRSALGGASGSAATASVHIPAPEIAPVKLRNVIGLLRGADPVLKDTYLLITAHYDHLGMRDNGTPDHIFNGANDDASGTASVIEIANALAALPERPRRSIVFMAQFGEELGDLGSRYYAQHPVFPIAKTIADVNLEQLGRTDDAQGPHVGMFNLTGFDFTDLPAVLRRAGQVTGIRVVKDEKNSDPYFTRSDNAAFANVGVPSTTLSVAYDFPDYHRPGDEWPKLDYENMAKVDVTIALAALDIANNSQAPKWNEGNPKTQAFRK